MKQCLTEGCFIDCETLSREFSTKYKANIAESPEHTSPKEANNFGRCMLITLFVTRSYMIPNNCFGKSSTRWDATFAVAISLERSSGSGVMVER